ncbi:FAD-dependent oxidoreductase [Sphaerisporangium rubeum]|uniref:NADH dehydrogenase FAD-containing subunit n=1 Tax=Sphaerisporangium rubeum TaxID=321317 RepID=A0A7X0M8C4_9ACTN|nr:FAD-dependent oxidoreductase [Sphaerisporangium rubeum]MBB6473914.1 NADH dehydrogenase FAD-containing subunit [Sphaerisporangium rubeum]
MTHHIVVIGAGYSGVIAANLTARLTGARVTLVNENDGFVERVRLHQLAAGQVLRDLPLADVLEPRVEPVIDRVTALDPEARTVRLGRSGRDVAYDTLVYALGSRADMASVPGVAEHAFTVAGPAEAVRLRDHLAAGAAGGVLAVAGGGLTGIEAAAELAETYPGLKVRLVTDGVAGAGLSPYARRHLRATFTRLGVEVRENARVAEVRADGLVLDDGEHIAAGTVVWTAGFTVPALAREAGLAVDGRGRVIVDGTLRSVSHPDVLAVGDAAALRTEDGKELRMACATGIPSAQQAARAIAARLAGREPRPLRFRYFNQCVSLGRRDGIVQFVRTDDTPRRAALTGRVAARYKEAIVKGTVYGLRHPSMPTYL